MRRFQRIHDQKETIFDHAICPIIQCFLEVIIHGADKATTCLDGGRFSHSDKSPNCSLPRSLVLYEVGNIARLWNPSHLSTPIPNGILISRLTASMKTNAVLQLSFYACYDDDSSGVSTIPYRGSPFPDSARLGGDSLPLLFGSTVSISSLTHR